MLALFLAALLFDAGHTGEKRVTREDSGQTSRRNDACIVEDSLEAVCAQTVWTVTRCRAEQPQIQFDQRC